MIALYLHVLLKGHINTLSSHSFVRSYFYINCAAPITHHYHTPAKKSGNVATHTQSNMEYFQSGTVSDGF